MGRHCAHYHSAGNDVSSQPVKSSCSTGSEIEQRKTMLLYENMCVCVCVTWLIVIMLLQITPRSLLSSISKWDFSYELDKPACVFLNARVAPVWQALQSVLGGASFMNWNSLGRRKVPAASGWMVCSFFYVHNVITYLWQGVAIFNS